MTHFVRVEAVMETNCKLTPIYKVIQNLSQLSAKVYFQLNKISEVSAVGFFINLWLQTRRWLGSIPGPVEGWTLSDLLLPHRQ